MDERDVGKVNILYINHYAGSPALGMEYRPYYLAREWRKMGHHVTIVAGDFSHLRIKNPKVHKDFQKETIDGISYCWVRTGSYKGNGARRALTMFRFAGKLWRNGGRIAKTMKPDVIITSSTYHLDTFAGQRAARLRGAKLIHEVHDMWPVTLMELGGMKRWHPFVMLIQLAENSAYKNSDYVVSLLPCAKEYMTSHGMEENKFINIQNGIAMEDWEQGRAVPEGHQKLLGRLKVNKKFIVGYFGGHGLSNALDILLDAAKEMKIPEIAFVLVGNGVEKPRLMKRAREEGIGNVFFLDAVPKPSIGELLKYFDCSYIGGKESPLYRFGASLNKMYDAMMAGKPIVCALNAAECPVEAYQCGIMVKSGKIEDICRAVQKVWQMPEREREAMGKRGREAVMTQFNYHVLARKFEALFRDERKQQPEHGA